jgi:Leucine-rich repeat (LRR) protein
MLFAVSNFTVPIVQYDALYEFYKATGGDTWLWRDGRGMEWNFSDGSDPCIDQWQGLTCTYDEVEFAANIIAMNLTLYNLSGSIPQSIDALSHLTVLLLANNSLTNTIPSSVGNLQHLQSLILQQNQITGSIPATIGNLTNLKVFAMKYNRLEKTIPDTIGELSNLTLFDVYNNQLTGTLPETFAALQQLQYLDVYANRLDGTIPDFLGELSKLSYLYLGENRFHGTIPDNLGNLGNLVYLYINTNNLVGTIPTTLSQLTRLENLFLYDNKLEGSLAGVFDPTAQTVLSIVLLHENRITGQLPEELFAMQSLTLLDCSTNCMDGSLPATLCASTSLQTLALDGMVAASSCRIKLIAGLGTYRLKHELEGGLPPCVFELPRLTTLHISGNGITGSLPRGLAPSPTFSNIALSHNFLTGTIPLELQSRLWDSIDLSYNRLGGALSDNFTVQNASAVLKLGNNRLSGTIPDTVLACDGEVNILEGNLFACNFQKSDLPEQDTKLSSYQCGSNTFNVSYYFWLCATGVLGIIIMVFTVRQKKGEVTVFSAFVEALTQARSILNVIDLTDKHGRSFKPLLRRYKKICDICKLYMRLGCAIALFIVLILLPFYAVVSAFSSTLTFQYAYKVSIIFLSGPVTAGVAMVLLILMTFYSFGCFAMLLRRYQRGCVLFEREISFDAADSSMRDSASEKEQRFTREKVLVHAGLIFVDVVVVVGANVLFVFLVLYGNETLLPVAQAALSMFKILWSNVCAWTVNYMAVHMQFQSKNIRRAIFSLFFIITLFNNIVVPCLVVMAVSTTCFYNLAIQGHNIESSYQYQECVSYREGGCYEYTSITNKSSFRPPFIYSYQCSASFVTAYAPSFVYLCIISGFMIPAMRYVGYRLVRAVPEGSYVHSALMFVLPRILRPLSTNQSIPAVRGPYFDARRLIVTILNYLGILLTFGAMFPPLAVAITTTILSTVFYARLEVKRFLAEAARLNLQSHIEAIDADCYGVGSDTMLLRAMRVLLLLSYFFYTLFLFDILGDAVGLEKAFWVLIFMPLLPFVLDAIFRAYSGTAFVRMRLRVASSIAGPAGKTVELLRQIQQEATVSPMSGKDAEGEEVTVEC